MFADARLAELYDHIHDHAADRPFYLQLASELAPVDVVDLGCGTGSLALLLAARGHRVTGIDPSSHMLRVARSKPGADAVRWVDGGADVLGRAEADLVLMTGHVAQFFVRDAEWHEALRRISIALRPGGHLAFETRNPEGEAWRSWTRQFSTWTTELPDAQLENWYDAHAVHDGVVDYAFCWRFSTGQHVREEHSLIFRSYATVLKDLADAGLELEATYGDWDRSPVSAGAPELIFVARASELGGPELGPNPRRYRDYGEFDPLADEAAVRKVGEQRTTAANQGWSRPAGAGAM